MNAASRKSAQQKLEDPKKKEGASLKIGIFEISSEKIRSALDIASQKTGTFRNGNAKK